MLDHHMEKTDNSVSLVQDYIERKQVTIGQRLLQFSFFANGYLLPFNVILDKRN